MDENTPTTPVEETPVAAPATDAPAETPTPATDAPAA